MNLPGPPTPSLASPTSGPSLPPGRCGAFGEHSDFKLEFFRHRPLFLSFSLNSPSSSSSSSSASPPCIQLSSQAAFLFLLFFHFIASSGASRYCVRDDRRWVTEMRQTARMRGPCEPSGCLIATMFSPNAPRSGSHVAFARFAQPSTMTPSCVTRALHSTDNQRGLAVIVFHPSRISLFLFCRSQNANLKS